MNNTPNTPAPLTTLEDVKSFPLASFQACAEATRRTVRKAQEAKGFTVDEALSFVAERSGTTLEATEQLFRAGQLAWVKASLS